MEVRRLEAGEWKTFKGIFAAVFRSDLPHEKHATFYGVFDETGELKGFLLAEEVIFFGQIFSFGDDPKYINALIRHARSETPSTQSVAMVASGERFGKLFETLGLERIEGTLYRRG